MPFTPSGIYYPGPGDTFPPGFSGAGGGTGWLQQMAESVEDAIDASHEPLDVAQVTSGTAASLNLTVPAGVRSARVVGMARSSASGTSTRLRIAVNNHSTTNSYRSQRRRWSGDSTTPATSQETQDDFWRTTSDALPADGASESTAFAAVDILIPDVAPLAGRVRVQWRVGFTTTSESFDDFGQGRVLQNSVTSIQLSPLSSSFVTGTRFELRRG